MSIRLNFCRSVPPEFLRSFFFYQWGPCTFQNLFVLTNYSNVKNSLYLFWTLLQRITLRHFPDVQCFSFTVVGLYCYKYERDIASWRTTFWTGRRMLMGSLTCPPPSVPSQLHALTCENLVGHCFYSLNEDIENLWWRIGKIHLPFQMRLADQHYQLLLDQLASF